MNQLYGDLDLNGEIEKGGWSKTKSEEQPKNKSNNTNTQFVPTKIAITNINNASNSFNNSSTKSAISTNKVSLAFKPRQASSSSSNAFGKATTTIAINNKLPNIASSANIDSSPSYITNNFAPTQSDLNNTAINNISVLYESTTYNTFESSKENTYDNSIPETKIIEFDDTDVTYDCKDAYDPYKPNDYLVYCEERLSAKKQVYTYTYMYSYI